MFEHTSERKLLIKTHVSESCYREMEKRRPLKMCRGTFCALVLEEIFKTED